jgi:hypothetical protein
MVLGVGIAPTFAQHSLALAFLADPRKKCLGSVETVAKAQSLLLAQLRNLLFGQLDTLGILILREVIQ